MKKFFSICLRRSSFTFYKRTLALVLAFVMIFNLSSEVFAQALPSQMPSKTYFQETQEYKGQANTLTQELERLRQANSVAISYEEYKAEVLKYAKKNKIDINTIDIEASYKEYIAPIAKYESDYKALIKKFASKTYMEVITDSKYYLNKQDEEINYDGKKYNRVALLHAAIHNLTSRTSSGYERNGFWVFSQENEYTKDQRLVAMSHIYEVINREEYHPADNHFIWSFAYKVIEDGKEFYNNDLSAKINLMPKGLRSGDYLDKKERAREDRYKQANIVMSAVALMPVLSKSSSEKSQGAQVVYEHAKKIKRTDYSALGVMIASQSLLAMGTEDSLNKLYALLTKDLYREDGVREGLYALDVLSFEEWSNKGANAGNRRNQGLGQYHNAIGRRYLYLDPKKNSKELLQATDNKEKALEVLYKGVFSDSLEEIGKAIGKASSQNERVAKLADKLALKYVGDTSGVQARESRMHTSVVVGILATTKKRSSNLTKAANIIYNGYWWDISEATQRDKNNIAAKYLGYSAKKYNAGKYTEFKNLCYVKKVGRFADIALGAIFAAGLVLSLPSIVRSTGSFFKGIGRFLNKSIKNLKIKIKPAAPKAAGSVATQTVKAAETTKVSQTAKVSETAKTAETAETAKASEGAKAAEEIKAPRTEQPEIKPIEETGRIEETTATVGEGGGGAIESGEFNISEEIRGARAQYISDLASKVRASREAKAFEAENAARKGIVSKYKKTLLINKPLGQLAPWRKQIATFLINWQINKEIFLSSLRVFNPRYAALSMPLPFALTGEAFLKPVAVITQTTRAAQTGITTAEVFRASETANEAANFAKAVSTSQNVAKSADYLKMLQDYSMGKGLLSGTFGINGILNEYHGGPSASRQISALEKNNVISYAKQKQQAKADIKLAKQQAKEQKNESFKQAMTGLRRQLFGNPPNTKLYATVLPITISVIIKIAQKVGDLINKKQEIEKAFNTAEEKTLDVMANKTDRETREIFLKYFEEELASAGISNEKIVQIIQKTNDYFDSIQEDIKDIQVYDNMSVEEIIGEDPKGIILEFTKVIKENPNDDLAYYYIAKAQEKLKNYEEAVASYQEALKIKPANKIYQECLKQAQQKQEEIYEQDQKNKAENYYKEAQLAYNNEDLVLALKYYKQAISADPDNAKYYYAIAEFYRDVYKDDYIRQLALENYNKAIALDSKNGDYYYARAVLKKYSLNDNSGAIKDLALRIKYGGKDISVENMFKGWSEQSYDDYIKTHKEDLKVVEASVENIKYTPLEDQIISENASITITEKSRRLRRSIPQSFILSPGYFRGMTLHSFAEVEAILKEGLPRAKTNYDDVYFSPDIELSFVYANSYGDERLIPVLLKNINYKELTPVDPLKSEYVSGKDVSPAEIGDVIVWTTINGKKGWYKATLNEDGKLVLKHYEEYIAQNSENALAEQAQADYKENQDELKKVKQKVKGNLLGKYYQRATFITLLTFTPFKELNRQLTAFLTGKPYLSENKIDILRGIIDESAKDLEDQNLTEAELEKELIKQIFLRIITDNRFTIKEKAEIFKTEISREYMAKAINEEINNLWVYDKLPLLEVISGEPEESIKIFTQLLMDEPSESLFYYYRAKAYASLGNYTEAIKDLYKAIFLDPLNDKYFYTRALFNRSIKDYKRAAKDLSNAIRLARNISNKQRVALYSFELAVIQDHFLGETKEAIKNYETALKLDPSNQIYKASLEEAKENLEEEDINAKEAEKSSQRSYLSTLGMLADFEKYNDLKNSSISSDDNINNKSAPRVLVESEQNRDIEEFKQSLEEKQFSYMMPDNPRRQAPVQEDEGNLAEPQNKDKVAQETSQKPYFSILGMFRDLSKYEYLYRKLNIAKKNDSKLNSMQDTVPVENKKPEQNLQEEEQGFYDETLEFNLLDQVSRLRLASAGENDGVSRAQQIFNNMSYTSVEDVKRLYRAFKKEVELISSLMALEEKGYANLTDREKRQYDINSKKAIPIRKALANIVFSLNMSESFPRDVFEKMKDVLMQVDSGVRIYFTHKQEIAAQEENKIVTSENNAQTNRTIYRPEISQDHIYTDISDLVIVVMNDEPSIASYIADNLSQYSSKVFKAHTLYELKNVLEDLKQKGLRPHYFINDMNLGHTISGSDAMRLVKQTFPEIANDIGFIMWSDSSHLNNYLRENNYIGHVKRVEGELSNTSVKHPAFYVSYIESKEHIADKINKVAAPQSQAKAKAFDENLWQNLSSKTLEQIAKLYNINTKQIALIGLKGYLYQPALDKLTKEAQANNWAIYQANTLQELGEIDTDTAKIFFIKGKVDRDFKDNLFKIKNNSIFIFVADEDLNIQEKERSFADDYDGYYYLKKDKGPNAFAFNPVSFSKGIRKPFTKYFSGIYLPLILSGIKVPAPKYTEKWASFETMNPEEAVRTLNNIDVKQLLVKDKFGKLPIEYALKNKNFTRYFDSATNNFKSANDTFVYVYNYSNFAGLNANTVIDKQQGLTLAMLVLQEEENIHPFGLIAREVDIAKTDKQGNSILKYIIEGENPVETASILFSNLSDKDAAKIVNIKNKKGQGVIEFLDNANISSEDKVKLMQFFTAKGLVFDTSDISWLNKIKSEELKDFVNEIVEQVEEAERYDAYVKQAENSFLNPTPGQAVMSKEGKKVSVEVLTYIDETLAERFVDLLENINEVNDDGYTALMYAAKNPNSKITELILKKGGRANIATSAGRALLIAREAGNTEVIKILEKKDKIFKQEQKNIKASQEQIFDVDGDKTSFIGKNGLLPRNKDLNGIFVNPASIIALLTPLLNVPFLRYVSTDNEVKVKEEKLLASIYNDILKHPFTRNPRKIMAVLQGKNKLFVLNHGLALKDTSNGKLVQDIGPDERKQYGIVRIIHNHIQGIAPITKSDFMLLPTIVRLKPFKENDKFILFHYEKSDGIVLKVLFAKVNDEGNILVSMQNISKEDAAKDKIAKDYLDSLENSTDEKNKPNLNKQKTLPLDNKEQTYYLNQKDGIEDVSSQTQLSKPVEQAKLTTEIKEESNPLLFLNTPAEGSTSLAMPFVFLPIIASSKVKRAISKTRKKHKNLEVFYTEDIENKQFIALNLNARIDPALHMPDQYDKIIFDKQGMVYYSGEKGTKIISNFYIRLSPKPADLKLLIRAIKNSKLTAPFELKFTFEGYDKAEFESALLYDAHQNLLNINLLFPKGYLKENEGVMFSNGVFYTFDKRTLERIREIENFYLRVPKRKNSVLTEVFLNSPIKPTLYFVPSFDKASVVYREAMFTNISLGKTFSPIAKKELSLTETGSTALMLGIQYFIPMLSLVIKPLIRKMGEKKTLLLALTLSALAGAMVFFAGFNGLTSGEPRTTLQKGIFITAFLFMSLSTLLRQLVSTILIGDNSGVIDDSRERKNNRQNINDEPITFKDLFKRKKKTETNVYTIPRDLLFSKAFVYKSIGSLVFLTFPFVINKLIYWLSFGKINPNLDYAFSFPFFAAYSIYSTIRILRTNLRDRSVPSTEKQKDLTAKKQTWKEKVKEKKEKAKQIKNSEFRENWIKENGKIIRYFLTLVLANTHEFVISSALASQLNRVFLGDNSTSNFYIALGLYAPLLIGRGIFNRVRGKASSATSFVVFNAFSLIGTLLMVLNPTSQAMLIIGAGIACLGMGNTFTLLYSDVTKAYSKDKELTISSLGSIAVAASAALTLISPKLIESGHFQGALLYGLFLIVAAILLSLPSMQGAPIIKVIKDLFDFSKNKDNTGDASAAKPKRKRPFEDIGKWWHTPKNGPDMNNPEPQN